MKSNVIKELNTFLEGNFMAIHAYENYIHHIDDVDIKQVLQKIQQEHKQHAMMIAERIQNLDGIPVDDAGMMGNVAEFINKIKGSTKGSTDILKDALVGEHRGIEKSKKLLDGDLDPESRALVKNILDVDQKHVDLLDRLAH
ncbi:ferritin-like domain-containing protein [Sporosarcina sp. Marseille-Q4063]|uniref:ferritin-like domain-containing protein n=1 Tax=Sporosarcina sp. Marseille-Q4063 TaxID=2810514 RepID=UPI001BB0688E|nr:ferritin-like domain-containing protein [Sporosarcina sp. Marseille-Q4063]QUW22730.1 ferritin-like domain-containing protein [Sporosarcina sp. Marseille-Q4063]